MSDPTRPFERPNAFERLLNRAIGTLVRLGIGLPHMLSRDDDELLTRTGPGTAMGALLRRYWIPVLQSSELSPGGRVKRVQLLGERLIAYRTPGGAPGVIGEFCPHRGASLYFGRVEEAGMLAAGSAGQGLGPRTMYERRYAECHPGGFEPKARLQAMDLEGIDAALLFPTFSAPMIALMQGTIVVN